MSEPVEGEILPQPGGHFLFGSDPFKNEVVVPVDSVEVCDGRVKHSPIQEATVTYLRVMVKGAHPELTRTGARLKIELAE